MKKLFLATVLVISSAAAAQSETYRCKFHDPGRYNTIPKEVLVKIAPNNAGAEVVDPILLSERQAPKAARFVDNNSKLLRVRWRVDGATFRGGAKSDMDFSMVYRKARNRASITLTIANFDNTDSGTGHCVLE